ncbi:MAG: hypothetical protein N2749_04450 [Clostridia bacterium]|nr:hypothetical protein [Clostridia bacterium]
MQNREDSLIAMIMIILILAILSGALILTLSQSSPLDSTKKTSFLNDVKSFEEELDLYKTTQDLNSDNEYLPYKLYADENTLVYNSEKLEGNITTVIPSLLNTDKYVNEFEIVGGQLWYKGTDTQKQSWSQYDAKIKIDDKKPKVSILTNQVLPVKEGTNVEYTLIFSSETEITKLNLEDKIKVTGTLGSNISIQPDILISEVIGESTDKYRIVKIRIDTNNMSDGKYKIKVLTGASININNNTNEDKVSSNIFEVNSIAKDNPMFKVISQDLKTKVVIVPSNDKNKIQYSLDGSKYKEYIEPVEISKGALIYARETNVLTNETVTSTLKNSK